MFLNTRLHTSTFKGVKLLISRSDGNMSIANTAACVRKDIRLFLSWGTDYVQKDDFTEFDQMQELPTAVRNALN